MQRQAVAKLAGILEAEIKLVEGASGEVNNR
jgi:hypothetical protein